MSLKQRPQSQASLTDQLKELIQAANKLGLYDAADYLTTVTKGKVRRRREAVQVRSIAPMKRKQTSRLEIEMTQQHCDQVTRAMNRIEEQVGISFSLTGGRGFGHHIWTAKHPRRVTVKEIFIIEDILKLMDLWVELRVTTEIEVRGRA